MEQIIELVGMITGPIGAVIIEKCSLPERFWNSELSNYVFKDLVNKIDDAYPPKESLLKLLQLNEENINSVFSIAEGIVRSEEFKILAPSFIKKVLDSILNALKSFIRGINKQIVQQIDRFYDEKMAESNLKANYTAHIARIAGVVNGIVDFVAGLFVFMGIAGNEPFDFLLDFNMETIIELFNKIIRLVERIVNTNIFLALLSSLITFLDNIKEIELPDINTDKLSYGFGFITVFIATCFIPVAEGAKASNLKKILSILPEGVLDNVAAAAGKAEVLAGKVKNKAIALLDDIINFVNKSYAELKKFFDDLFAKIKKWLLKNKRVAWMSSSLFKFGDDATTIANYIRLSKRTEDGWRNILCHGTSKSVIINNIHYKPEKFAKLLIEQGYQKGTPIRLIACNTGSKSNGFAQKLAKELETKVLAPTDKIRVDDWGEFIIHNKGKFIEFK